MKGTFFLGLCTKQYSVFLCNFDSSYLVLKQSCLPTTLCINVCWMKDSSGIEIEVSKIHGYRFEIQGKDEETAFPKGMKSRRGLKWMETDLFLWRGLLRLIEQDREQEEDHKGRKHFRTQHTHQRTHHQQQHLGRWLSAQKGSRVSSNTFI